MCLVLNEVIPLSEWQPQHFLIRVTSDSQLPSKHRWYSSGMTNESSVIPYCSCIATIRQEHTTLIQYMDKPDFSHLCDYNKMPVGTRCDTHEVFKQFTQKWKFIHPHLISNSYYSLSIDSRYVFTYLYLVYCICGCPYTYLSAELANYEKEQRKQKNVRHLYLEKTIQTMIFAYTA